MEEKDKEIEHYAYTKVEIVTANEAKTIEVLAKGSDDDSTMKMHKTLLERIEEKRR